MKPAPERGDFIMQEPTTDDARATLYPRAEKKAP